MPSLLSSAPRHDDDGQARGGPIAGLVIAIPLSLMLWGIIMYVLFNLIR